MNEPLISNKISPWRRKVSSSNNNNHRISKLGYVRSTTVVLIWQFSTGLFFNLFLATTSYIQNVDVKSTMWFTIVLSVIFLGSPLAGYIADVKYGRFKVLTCGTYFLLTSTIAIFVIFVILAVSVYTYDASGWALFILLLGSVLVYCIGAVLFLSNVIQFGTDQLRDAPTKYSVYFIYAFFWVDSISKFISRCSYWPGHQMVISQKQNTLGINQQRGIFTGVILAFSIISTIIALILVHKKRNKWFLTENSKENPYKLVYNVLHFAIHHNKPIKRSAFTYCESERPSRLDFSKKRFGGPYTTEQVEDVKVMLNILKVVFSFSPVFMLESFAASSFITNANQIEISHKVNDPVSVLFFDYGILVPLFTLVFIPLWLCMFKRNTSKFAPNMFKRVGIALGILIVVFLAYILLDCVAFNNTDDHFNIHRNMCIHHLNKTYTVNRSYVNIPTWTISVMQQMLVSLYQVFLYTAAYEFISCQSPQHMKGILFGLFYSLRSLYQFIAAIVTYLFIFHWTSTVMSCHTGYFMLNFSVGVANLIAYTTIARKYKYRKRDDICHVYKFAEDYYSTSY